MNHLPFTFQTLQELRDNPLNYSKDFFDNIPIEQWSDIESLFRINVLSKIKMELWNASFDYPNDKFKRLINQAVNQSDTALDSCNLSIKKFQQIDNKEYEIQLVNLTKKFIDSILNELALYFFSESNTTRKLKSKLNAYELAYLFRALVDSNCIEKEPSFISRFASMNISVAGGKEFTNKYFKNKYDTPDDKAIIKIEEIAHQILATAKKHREKYNS